MGEKTLVQDQTYSAQNDEIDLFDLWDDIVEQKLWLILGFLGCLTLACIYVFQATPIYQAKVVIKSASANSMVELNVPQLKGIYSKTLDEAFADARSALLSKEFRQDFYQAYLDEIKSVDGIYNEALSQQQNFAQFDDLFSTKSSDNKDIETFFQITFELPDAKKAADLLNSYIDFSLAAKLIDVKDTIQSKVSIQVSKLEYDAMQLRERYKGEQTRRYLLVNEAHSIAQSVGQSQPILDKIDIVGTYELPLYMYGTKALKAEESAIKNRQQLAKELPYGEDHFIDKIPDLLFKIDQLKSLEIDYTKVNLVAVDEKAIPPVYPIKPKKRLILALGGVAGVFVGLMLALIVASFKRRKNQAEVNAQI